MNVLVAPSVRELEPFARQIGVWLGTRLPQARDIRIENLSYPFGAGQSHETVLFDASWIEDGERVEQGCVVRVKPTAHTMFPDNLFEEQYKIMRHVHESGRVRVAKPLWFEDDTGVLGAPFFVMERVRGRVPVSVPPYREKGWVAEASAAQRAKMWEGGVRQLATIQLVSREGCEFLKGPSHAQAGLAQEWDKYERFVRMVSAKRRWPPLEAALKRLSSSQPKNQPPGLVWGDARIGNMMFDDAFDVVAVMDWEQPSLGGALHDLAWWLVLSEMMHGAVGGKQLLAGMGTRAETIALWQEITGVSTADIEWYEDFTQLKLSCLSVRMADLRGWPDPNEADLARRLKVA